MPCQNFLDVAGQHAACAEQIDLEHQEVLARHKDTPLLSLLILDNDGECYERMEKLLAKTGISRVFFLQGGIEGYRSFLEQQASLLQPPQQPKKVVGRCASCP